MKTVATTDRAIEEAVAAMVREFESEIKSVNEDGASSTADDYLATVEKKFASTLRERLKSVESKLQSATDVTIDHASDVDTGVSSSDTAAVNTIDFQTGHSSQQSADADTFDFDTGRSDQKIDETVDLAGQSTARDTQAPNPKRKQTREADAPDGYEILGTLGKGGMGIVYKAKHLPLNRLVAIKMVLAGKHASEKMLSRFKAEAEAAAHLTHPNIVAVYEVGEHENMPFFSIEYVEGNALNELLSDASMTEEKSVELMEKISRAVHYSHERGIAHRDLKPQNVLINEEGEPKVADFGLAKRLDDPELDQTKTGEIMGTPGYMAPEQARGEKSIGPHTDVYALGAIMYHMLTGRAPFVGPTPFETIKQVLAEDAISPSRLHPDLDRDLETICLKCLEKEASRRYASAADLADDLRRVQDGKPIVARPVTQLERMSKWCKRNPRIASLLAVAGTLFLVLLVGGYGSALVINNQKVAEREAKEAAKVAQGRAEEAQDVAEKEEEKAKEAQKKAEESEALANEQAELALDATRVVIYKTQNYFKSKPQYNDLRKEMLDSILVEVERVYQGDYKYDVKEVFRASALRQLGEIYFEVGEKEKAFELLMQADEIARRLHKAGELPQPHRSLDVLDQAIGDALVDMTRYDEAEARYKSALQHRKDYFKEHPAVEIAQIQSLEDVNSKLGNLMIDRGKPDEARAYIEASLEARQLWFDMFEKLYAGRTIQRGRLERMEQLAGAKGRLSVLREKAGEFDEMQTAGDEALQLLRILRTKKPDEFAANFNLAQRKRIIGRQHLICKRNVEALAILRESTAEFEACLKIDPNHSKTIETIADAYYLLGIAEQCVGGSYEATFAKAIETQRSLLTKSKTLSLRGGLLIMLARAGEIDEARQIAAEIEKEGDSLAHCMYCGLGYGLLSLHFGDDPKEQASLHERAIAGVRDAIRKGYHNFSEMRLAEVNFAVLQQLDAYQKMLDEEEARVAKEKVPKKK